jgi:hypothetical protein
MTLHDLGFPELTPEEALRLCDILDALHTMVWRAHGLAMNLHLEGLDMPLLEPDDDSDRL